MAQQVFKVTEAHSSVPGIVLMIAPIETLTLVLDLKDSDLAQIGRDRVERLDRSLAGQAPIPPTLLRTNSPAFGDCEVLVEPWVKEA